jgi:DNA-binding transcriptional LysR family regulator
MHDELAVVVSANHRWAARRHVQPHDLAADHYLTRERDSGTRAVVTAALADAGIELEPALVTPSIGALKRAVLDGGFTVLSHLAVEGEVATGTLRALGIRGIDLGRELQAVRRDRPPRASAAGRLWAWLRDRP